MGAKIDYLVGMCVRYNKLLEQIFDETGMEGKRSALSDHFLGTKPAYQRTIESLSKHIDRQDRWLEKRKEEVALLHKALEHANERKEVYKRALLDHNIIIMRDKDNKVSTIKSKEITVDLKFDPTELCKDFGI